MRRRAIIIYCGLLGWVIICSSQIAVTPNGTTGSITRITSLPPSNVTVALTITRRPGQAAPTQFAVQQTDVLGRWPTNAAWKTTSSNLSTNAAFNVAGLSRQFFRVGLREPTNTLTLTWSQTFTTNAPVDGYYIERQTGTNDWQVIAAPVTTNTWYVDHGLLPSTIYCYQISAFNIAGVSSNSNTACATTDL